MRVRIILLLACTAMLAAAGAHAQDQPRTTVIRLRMVSAADAVEIINQIYQGAPGVVVAEYSKGHGVTVRADAKTTQEIRELVAQMEKAARPLPQIVVVKLGAPDPNVIADIIRAINGLPTHDNAGNRIVSVEAGPAGLNVGAFTPGAFGGQMRGFGGIGGGPIIINPSGIRKPGGR